MEKIVGSNCQEVPVYISSHQKLVKTIPTALLNIPEWNVKKKIIFIISSLQKYPDPDPKSLIFNLRF